MSCLALEIDIADKRVFKVLAVSIDGNYQANSFRPPKNYKPTKQAVCCTRNVHGILWNSGHLDFSDLSIILSNEVKSEKFAKRTEKCMNHGSLMCKEMENWEDHGCPKVQNLVVD